MEAPLCPTERIISINKLEIVVGLIVAMLSLASAIGSWYILPYRVAQTEAAVRNFTATIDEIKIFNATAGANRFTSSDWMKAKMSLDEHSLATEKRLTRTEDAVTSLRAQLDRIEKKLDGLK